MSEDINRIMKCLTLSVEENEIKNLQSLSWAINKLENFSMTFDMLDQSRIGQTLQSVRHSKKISGDLSERIRYLIKCWRRLLDVNCLSVIPNEIRKALISERSLSEINGIKNGYNKESINNINGIKYTSSLDLTKAIENSKSDIDTKEIVNTSIKIVDSNEHLKNGIIPNKIDQSSEEISTNSFINHTDSCNKSNQIEENKTEITINHFSNETLIDSCNNDLSSETTRLNEKEVITDLDTEISENQVVSQVLENNSTEIKQNEKQEQNISVIENDAHKNSEENQNTALKVENSSSIKQLNQENIFQETNQLNSCNTDENSGVNNESINASRTNQIGKPKLKSTKELLADFSNLIDANTKNKILMDKITQEDDDPISYHPETFKLREIIQRNLIEEKLQPQQQQHQQPIETDEILKLSDLDKEIDEIIAMKRETKCDKLLKKFQSICGIQPKIIFKPMIPWKNLKRGIDCSSPCIKQPKSAVKRTINEDGSINIGEPQNKYTISDIDDLLQTFELRSQRKDMITEAIMKRKETQIVDNTQSITDLSLKLKLKIPQQKIQILKLKKRKKKKKKKKPKLKPKIVIKKPRKPRIKPKPPITNYLDDLPKLPELREESFVEIFNEENQSENRMNFENSDENIKKFTYEFVEGYNCTKHTQTNELIELTKMYSILIDKTYLHVFPWVDLEYPIKSTFNSESEEIIQSALDLPPLFS